MNTVMNATATKPSANAIGMPENITTSVTPPNRRPSARTLICDPRTEWRSPVERGVGRPQSRGGAPFGPWPADARPPRSFGARLRAKVADRLQRELQHEQRHPGAHEPVGNR